MAPSSSIFFGFSPVSQIERQNIKETLRNKMFSCQKNCISFKYSQTFSRRIMFNILSEQKKCPCTILYNRYDGSSVGVMKVRLSVWWFVCRCRSVGVCVFLFCTIAFIYNYTRVIMLNWGIPWTRSVSYSWRVKYHPTSHYPWSSILCTEPPINGYGYSIERYLLAPFHNHPLVIVHNLEQKFIVADLPLLHKHSTQVWNFASVSRSYFLLCRWFGNLRKH